MIAAAPSFAVSPRARGEIRARFERAGAATRIARLYETGGLRLRFPKADAQCEAVLINTAGGIVGGDSATLRFAAGPGVDVLVTTQSAEKIYRSDGARALLHTHLTLEAGACMDYLPQEAILFDRADFARKTEVDMAADATLTLCESIVFGRLAMGENCAEGLFRESWRIRRAGRLVFADETQLLAPTVVLDRPALGAGARALALLVRAAPESEACRDRLRTEFENSDCAVGVSAFNGLCVLRAAAVAPALLRTTLARALEILRGRDAPRVWR